MKTMISIVEVDKEKDYPRWNNLQTNIDRRAWKERNKSESVDEQHYQKWMRVTYWCAQKMGRET